MIFGIMGAMPDEVDQLCAKLENVTVEPYGGVDYHKGTLAGKQVVVCCAGMGKANAAATTQVLITKFGAEKIIFSGIAGNMTSKIGIGDVVIGKTVLYHDAQLDMICQNPPFLKEYTGDPELIAAAEKACAEAGVKALVGKIATGDLFVGDSETKAAIEAADVVLMDDDPAKIALAMRIARRTLRIVHQNIVFALGIKALCLLLGALGIAGMWAAIFADVGVMVIAVLNATRALYTKDLTKN